MSGHAIDELLQLGECDGLLIEKSPGSWEAVRQFHGEMKTAANGVYERRDELPDDFHDIGKPTLVALVESLLASEAIVQALVSGSGSRAVKWLDIPDGPIAQGQPNFIAGYQQRKRWPSDG
jgi:hypothetical protein